MALKLNQTEMGEVLSLSPRQIRNLEADGLPVTVEGRKKSYPAAACVAWIRRRDIDEIIEANQTDAMEAAKLRKMEAEAESKELDVRVKRGELVPLDEVESLVREALEAIDSVLRHVPSRFAPALARLAKIAVKEARAVLRDVVESVRMAIREADGSD